VPPLRCSAPASAARAPLSRAGDALMATPRSECLRPGTLKHRPFSRLPAPSLSMTQGRCVTVRGEVSLQYSSGCTVWGECPVDHPLTMH